MRLTTATELLRGASKLGRTISRWGFFTLAFGAVVGSGWVVVLGEWLNEAGPGGTAIGFLAGGCVMVLIGLCYGELAARFSTAGGEFLYTLETFGPRAGFLVGWYLTLYAIAICAFEAIACGWFIRALVPTIGLRPLYTLAGTSVTLDAVLIGLIGAMGIGALHYRGGRSAIGFQNIVTFGFIAVSLGLIVVGLSLGSPANLRPLWATTTDHSWLTGALWIFPTCAFFLNGWQTALHAIEERRSDVTVRAAVLSMVAAIFATAVFYIGITLSAASMIPWAQLVHKDLAASAAFAAVGLKGVLGLVVLAAAVVSLTKTWSAMAWLGSRILFAQARHGFLPRFFTTVDARSGAPRPAIVAVTVLTMAGSLLGRGAILPIVDMVSLCMALSLVLCMIVLLKRRRIDLHPPSFTVPGGKPVIMLALIGGVLMIGLALLQPILRGTHEIPLQWILLLTWGAVGLVVWRGTRGQRSRARIE